MSFVAKFKIDNDVIMFAKFSVDDNVIMMNEVKFNFNNNKLT